MGSWWILDNGRLRKYLFIFWPDLWLTVHCLRLNFSLSVCLFCLSLGGCLSLLQSLSCLTSSFSSSSIITSLLGLLLLLYLRKGSEVSTINQLVNRGKAPFSLVNQSRLNTSQPIKANLECSLCTRRPSSSNSSRYLFQCFGLAALKSMSAPPTSTNPL